MEKSTSNIECSCSWLQTFHLFNQDRCRTFWYYYFSCQHWHRWLTRFASLEFCESLKFNWIFPSFVLKWKYLKTSFGIACSCSVVNLLTTAVKSNLMMILFWFDVLDFFQCSTRFERAFLLLFITFVDYLEKFLILRTARISSQKKMPSNLCRIKWKKKHLKRPFAKLLRK
jgi:hypothetical protein